MTNAIEKLLSRSSMSLAMGELSEQEYTWAQEQARHTLQLLKEHDWHVVQAESSPTLLMRMALRMEPSLGSKRVEALVGDRRIDAILGLLVEAQTKIARQGQNRLPCDIVEQLVKQPESRTQDNEARTRASAARYVLTNFSRYGAIALPSVPSDELLNELADIVGNKRGWERGQETVRQETLWLYEEVCSNGLYKPAEIQVHAEDQPQVEPQSRPRGP